MLLVLYSSITRAQRIYFSDTTNRWIRKTVISNGASNAHVSYNFFEISDSLVEWQGKTYSLLPDMYGTGVLLRDDTLTGRYISSP